MAQNHSPEPEVEVDDHDGDDGVDVTLIRWMLAKTPLERLRTLESAVRSLEKLRGRPFIES